MRIERATVAGASGFIGRYLVRRLARRGAVINAVSRNAEQSKVLQPMGDVGQIATLKASLADETAMTACLAHATHAVNLVGILYESGAATFEAVHHEGAARFARLAKAAGAKRLVHVSAIGADAASGAAYARSKAAGEAAVRAAFPEATILRPSIVFGPEDDFFNRFASMATLSPVLPLIGGGHTRFQPVYVGDVADAIVAALTRPEAPGRVYELGGPRIYTFRELLEVMLDEIGRSPWFLNIPWHWAERQAGVLEKLPMPPLLTRDQVELLKSDNVVSPEAATLADLGIRAIAVEAIIPSYLDRFRKGGWFRGRGKQGAAWEDRGQQSVSNRT